MYISRGSETTMWPTARTIIAVVLILGVSLAAPQEIEDNAYPIDPPDQTCGFIVNITGLAENGPWFFAADVYECLTSVPFNAAVATRFIKYYNETLQFQSTLELLKVPPPSYRQPPVDLLGGLHIIQERVDSGAYHNQYAFEQELQSLILAAHDGHLTLYAGILNQFTFGSLYDLVSLSEDGIKPPEVYVWDDSLDTCISETNCTPSAVDNINSVPVVEFLTEFAKRQSIGLVEPHADWNQLMLSPALIIQGGLTTFGGLAPLYPGDELNITLRDDPSDAYDYYWTALYNSPGYTGPLTTGGDFYNYFVLGLTPPSFNTTPEYFAWINASESTTDNSDNQTGLTSWFGNSGAYPETAMVYQEDLGLYGAGIVTGYSLEGIPAAVLSIPSFQSDIDTFQQAVSNFVDLAQNTSTVIIDLQQNTGGEVALALTTFNSFFPGTLPYLGSRMRAQAMADALGQTLNSQFSDPSVSSDDYIDLLTSEWVVTDRINVQTGQNFSSWAEYFGPLPSYNDFFTLTQEYNLTDDLFDSMNLGVYFDGIFDTSVPQSAPNWQSDNIVMLTDGLCSSTCSLFLELMKQAGVRTVVVGGRPEPGPMQAASGTRGAASYSGSQLDSDITLATQLNATSQSQLPSRGNDTDTGMTIIYAGVNVRDQVRKNATLPNQLLYLPATCRIYWTFANFNNYTRLWEDTWNAIYNNTSLCVAGSTGIADQDGAISSRERRRDELSPDFDPGPYIVAGLNGSYYDPASIGVEDRTGSAVFGFPKLCDNGGQSNPSLCPPRTVCKKVTNSCGLNCQDKPSGAATVCQMPSSLSEWRCLEKTNNGGCSDTRLRYQIEAVNDGNVHSSGAHASRKTKNAGTSGYCYPRETSYKSDACNRLQAQWQQYDLLGY